jgi:hypothetical protein
MTEVAEVRALPKIIGACLCIELGKLGFAFAALPLKLCTNFPAPMLFDLLEPAPAHSKIPSKQLRTS